MNFRPVFESWYSAPASKNALRSPSNRETCVCIPDPGWAVNGLGMKVAQTPWLSATSRITVRKVMMLSAVVRASAYRRSISCWPGPPSWWLNSTEMPIDSSIVIASRRKSAPATGGVVEVAAAVDRDRCVPGVGSSLEQVELDLGVGIERQALIGGARSVRLST